MIWTPVTIQTISQIEALQNKNNLPATRIELMKSLTLVLRLKCYVPYLKTHVKRFRDKYADSISNRTNKISWNNIDEIAWRHFLNQLMSHVICHANRQNPPPPLVVAG